MKKILFVVMLLLGACSVFADTPVGPMNYQGRLLNNGIPVGYPTPTTANFVVRVYDAANGGVLKYQETHSNVTVDDGVYNFLVGTKTKDAGDSTWSVELWNCCANLYMEITANGETLLPRSRLAAAPYAFQANLALTTNNALALGGKSAAVYGGILADICTSGKGKWLDLVEKCLGIGASFPGPALTHWSALASDGNFANLDLSRADISGISFDGADLTGTIFKKTTYSVQGMSGANLRDTDWNSASLADVTSYAVSDTTDLTGAIFRNMDMSQWNMSNIPLSKVAGMSAAELSACPLGVPANWECRSDALGGSNNFLLGPGVNLSANSAAAISKFGASYLNLGPNALDNIDLTGASFEGNVITLDFQETILMNANFNYTTMRSNIFNSCDLNAATFVGSKLDKPTIMDSNVFVNNDFTNADLSYVRFNKTVEASDFTKATLTAVIFADGVSYSNFTGAVLDEVTMRANTSFNTFANTRFYHGFQHGEVNVASNTYGGGSTFSNLSFIGGELKGDFKGAVFTGITNFDNVTFTHLNLCGANIALLDPTVPHDDLSAVDWSKGLLRCPDSFLVAPNDMFHCNNFSGHMTPVPVDQCMAGVP